MKIITRAVLLICLALASLTSAASSVHPSLHRTNAQTMYAVSAVLRSMDGATIKVVQEFVIAESLNHALEVFASEAMTKYPGRTILDAVATPLPLPKPTCDLVA